MNRDKDRNVKNEDKRRRKKQKRQNVREERKNLKLYFLFVVFFLDTHILFNVFDCVQIKINRCRKE